MSTDPLHEPFHRPSAIEHIDQLAARGLTAAQIARISGRDLGYVEYRLALFRASNMTGGLDRWRISPAVDAEFVRQVVAEGARLGLLRSVAA